MRRRRICIRDIEEVLRNPSKSRVIDRDATIFACFVMECFRCGVEESLALGKVALCWSFEEAVLCVGGCDSGLLGAFLGCFGAADGGGAGGVGFWGGVE